MLVSGFELLFELSAPLQQTDTAHAVQRHKSDERKFKEKITDFATGKIK